MTAAIEASPITKLDHALRAARRGIRVFPCRPKGEKYRHEGKPVIATGKTPKFNGWQSLATTDETQIRAWWAEWPDANIGWATGDQLPDGRFMMALDVDMKRDANDQLLKNGKATLAALAKETDVEPGETLMQFTPSGLRPDGTRESAHLICSTSRLVAGGTDVLGPGLDVRGKGGYVVGDGSEIDGRPYTAPDMDAPILALPEAWESRLSAAVEKEPDRDPVDGVDPARACSWAVEHLQSTAGAKQGSRGSTAYKVSCELRDRGCSEADALSMMNLFWARKCEPPMPADDLAESVEHAYRYAMNRAGSTAPEAVFPPVEPSADSAPAGRVPVPYNTANLVQTVDDLEAAVLADPDRGPVFSFANGYVTVRQSKPVTVRDLSGGDYPPMALIHHFDPHSMLERLTRSAWLQRQDRKGDWKPATIPLDLVRMLLSRHGGNAPALTGIIEAPTIRQDGSVLSHEGYDPATGLLAMFNGNLFPDIATSPSQAQAAEALRFIEAEVFAEFPFANDVDRSAAAAALITGMVRHALGIAPAFLVSAPAQSTGKGALCETIGHGAFGRQQAATSWPTNDAEMAKFLLATLKEGQRAVMFDNIKDGSVVDSCQLAAAITSEKYTARVLGVSDTATVPTSVLWLLTGNNVRLAGDMPTRILKIYLDSKEERPDRRSFSRDLVPWVAQHRPQIVEAVLVIVRAYISAGSPDIVKTKTRFPAWDRLVRLPLIYAGGQDVSLKFDDAFTDDPVLSAWADVLDAWHELFASEAMRLSDVVKRLESHGLGTARTASETFNEPEADKATRLKEALKVALNDPRRSDINPGSLGKRLGQYENRPLGGKKLVRVNDTHAKANKWMVELIQ